MTNILVQIPAPPPREYPILIEAGLLSQPQTWLPRKWEKAVIITDDIVRQLYGEALLSRLKHLGQDVLLLSFPPGEHSKNNQTKQFLEEQMLAQACPRTTGCFALGGGVTGDLAGFISATYMRGIPVLQIPTTLLAMVDSSIGGKTSIDTPYGKNLIGAFWQPSAVIIDINCLKTLSLQHVKNGLFEVIKMALTHDRQLFYFIQDHLASCLAADLEILQSLIERAVKIKAAVVAEDEREHSGARALLNFGHTIGHALEQLSAYKMRHGFAVAYGILMEAKIAELTGILSLPEFNIIATLLARLGIHAHDLGVFSAQDIISTTYLDKKNRAGETHYVLLKSIGDVYIHPNQFTHAIEDKLIVAAWSALTGPI